MELKDLTGLVISELTVLGRTTGPTDARYWLCQCSCGRTKAYKTNYLLQRKAKVKTCGQCRPKCYKHGMTNTPEYAAWAQVKQRCFNPDDIGWKNYGGRGITMCEEWRASFSQFLADVGKRPSDLHSIERIETNGNYEPGNVRWATGAEQNRNRRDTRRLVFRGSELCGAEFARMLGVHNSTVYRRLDRGLSPEEIYSVFS